MFATDVCVSCGVCAVVGGWESVRGATCENQEKSSGLGHGRDQEPSGKGRTRYTWFDGEVAFWKRMQLN